MKDISLVAIDLAKASFQVHANDSKGKCVEKKTLNRENLKAYVSMLRPCIIAFEACGSAHYWAKVFLELGHTVRMIAPQHVKPFIKGNKNDKNDAAAIAEAAVRPSMNFVAVKSDEQLGVQALHRLRERYIKSRTMLSNEIRGFLFELGITVIKSVLAVKKTVAAIVHRDAFTDISDSFRVMLAEMHEELEDTEERIARVEKRLEKIAKESPTCQRLLTIPGVGLITSTAIISSVADPKKFKNGRQFAAWLGLVPGHSGTGGPKNNKLGGITKRGDPYIRKLLVHGSRSVLILVDKKEEPGAKWIKRIKDQKGWNKAAVALANKNARIIWALLNSEEKFDQKKMAKAI